MKIKAYLYLTHRWFGVFMCLLFAMWFCSGIVMMYVGFPQLNQAEKFSSLPALKVEEIKYSLKPMIAKLPEGSEIEELKLTTVGGRPLYLLKARAPARALARVPEEASIWYGRYADSGEPLQGISRAGAVLSAKQFVLESAENTSSEPISYEALVDMDQWSVSSRLNGHRPLHLVNLNDVAGTRLYISSLTGEVVRDTSASERAWNWLGANLHWIYPLQLRRHTSLWANVVIAISLLGLVTVMSGAATGLIRLRLRKPYGGKRYTPYRGVMKFHHVLGLCMLVFLSTYIFSGLMSMNPWGLFSDEGDSAIKVQAYKLNGRSQTSGLALEDNSELMLVLNRYGGSTIKEISWHWLGGQSYVLLHASDNKREVFMPREARDKNSMEEKIRTAIPLLLSERKIDSIDLLKDYDVYYYSHHGKSLSLPALRVKFLDEASTWLHIDLATGRVINELSAKARLQRWLFNGLHSLDFNILIQNRPLWDVLVIFLCLSGALFSLSAVVIACRRTKRSIRIQRFDQKRSSQN